MSIQEIVEKSDNMSMWEDGTIEIVVGKKMVDVVDNSRCVGCGSVLVKARSAVHFRIKSNPMLHGLMVGCDCGIKYHLRTDTEDYTYA